MDAICWTDWTPRIETLQSIETENKRRQKKGEKLLAIPNIGYFDCYGIWFLGDVVDKINILSVKKFGGALGTRTHVYLSVKPDKVGDGIHDLTAYGYKCRLYKWMAQGYHRGLVVSVNDAWANATALAYMESRTWSWILTDELKAALPPKR